MNMLMKTGILEQVSGKNKLLGGLGVGSISQSQMSKFKKILNNLTKSEKSFSSQFIRDILIKTHQKIDSENIPVSNELINFLYNKVESVEEGDIDIETSLLEGLLQQFVNHSLETGGPIAFEIGHESHGKIAVKFEPQNKKLSIESEVSEKLVANAGFMNIFSALDIEEIEFVDSKKISSSELLTPNVKGETSKKKGANLLAYKGVINDFSEVEENAKTVLFSFKKKKSEHIKSAITAHSDNDLPLGKPNKSKQDIPDETMEFTSKAQASEKTRPSNITFSNKTASVAETSEPLFSKKVTSVAETSEAYFSKKVTSVAETSEVPFSKKVTSVTETDKLGKSRVLKKSPLSGKVDAVSFIAQVTDSKETNGVKNDTPITSTIAKASIKSEFSEEIVGSIKPENSKSPKISQTQAVDAIKNTLLQSKTAFSGKAVGKFEVTMDVDERGKLTISSKKSNSESKTNIAVETPNAKDWLKAALTKKGISVDDIKIQVKADIPDEKAEIPKVKNDFVEKLPATKILEQSQIKIADKLETFSVPGKQDFDTEKASSAFKQISGMFRSVLKKVAAADVHEVPAKEKETIMSNLEKLEAKVSKSILDSGKVQHSVKVESDEALKWLEKELRPVADEIVKPELPVSKLTVAKEDVVKSALKPEVAVINSEQFDSKPVGKDVKGKPAMQTVNLINVDEKSDNDFSNESQLSENRAQAKDGLMMKEIQSTEFKVPVESHADGAQVVQVTTNNGPVQFEMVNGKLVPIQKLDTSYMPEMIQKIAELAKNQANLASPKLEVQMDIKDMGKVMVDALRHADKINLQIQVESSDVRRVLEAQLKPFVEQMAKDGIDIGKLDVSVRDEKQGNQHQLAHDFSQSRNQNREERQSFENLRDFFAGFEGETQIRQDIEHKQVREKVTENQTVEIWA